MIDKIRQVTEKRKKLAKIKPFLRPRIREKRKNFLKLPNLWWTICLAVSAFLLCIVSFYFHTKGHQWLPNVLVSIACGIVTGLVLYFLSNIRNNKMAHIQKELRVLSEMKEPLKTIEGLSSYYYLSRSPTLKELINIPKSYVLANEFLEALKTLQELQYKLSLDTFKELGLYEDNPFTEAKIQEYKDKLNLKGIDEKYIMELSKEFYPFMGRFKEVLMEKEDIVNFLGTLWI